MPRGAFARWGAHVALADALLLYARTETWVTPERYQTFFSEPVKLVPLPKDHEWKSGEGASAEPAGGSDAGDARTSAQAQAATKPKVKLAQAFKGDLENVMKKKYQPHSRGARRCRVQADHLRSQRESQRGSSRDDVAAGSGERVRG